MNVDAPAETGHESGARCVLWHARGRKPPAELLGALSRRGFGVRAVQSAYTAFAELCLLARRSSHGTPRAVLLLVEPETLTDRAGVLEAMRRYAPGAVAWVCEAGANKPLREFVEERAARPPQDRPAGSLGPALRLAGDGPPLEERDEDADKEEGAGLGHLLSDEELAMLLEEPQGRAGGHADD